MIVCRNLTKTFDGFVAVDDVSFTVGRGTVCALLGPNGSGKSTIMRMLAGLLAPSAGLAEIEGRSVAADPMRVKRTVGVLPEGLGLFDALTIEEHLQLTGDVHGLTRRETKARAGQLLAALDLGEDRDTFAEHCSHGMRKKTALAMALLPNPRALLLDEPFEGLDPVASRTIGSILATAGGRGVTVFLASHILTAVGELASHILLIRSGRILLDSATEKMPESLEAAYFGLVEQPEKPDLPWLGSAAS